MLRVNILEIEKTAADIAAAAKNFVSGGMTTSEVKSGGIEKTVKTKKVVSATTDECTPLLSTLLLNVTEMPLTIALASAHQNHIIKLSSI